MPLLAWSLRTALVMLVIAGLAALVPRDAVALRRRLWTAAPWLALALPAVVALVPDDVLFVVGSAPVATAVPATWPWLLWGAGVTAMLLWAIPGWRWRAAVRRGARPADARSTALARDIARRTGVRQEITLLLSDDVASPLTWGVASPVICLPADVITWDTPSLHRALWHEHAHVRAADHAMRGVAWGVVTLQWFNPLAWFAARQLIRAQEMAADRSVVDAGGDPREYARLLLALAPKVPSPRGVAASALGADTPGELERRIRAVLRGGGTRRPAWWHGPALAVALALGVAMIAAGRTLGAPPVMSLPTPRPLAPPPRAPAPPPRPIG